ncbi:MAG: Abi family protein [Deltaproteobacteria bacterium]
MMEFTKPPLLFEQQIELLRSRGMDIGDKERARRYLSHINYYRLRAYWLPFEEKETNGEHKFRAGTTWHIRVKNLIKKYASGKTISMGFPTDWRELSLWQNNENTD